MRYLALTIILLFLIIPGISGQDKSEALSQPGKLSFNFKSLSFVKNNEYFNPIEASGLRITSSLPWPADKSQWIEGYTLTGFFIQPELIYKPSQKISIRGGVHLLKYPGLKRFSSIRPVFSASLELSPRTTITIGSLDGSDKHLMFDPHFNKERIYNSYLEDGFQLRTINDHFFNDTWLNWENYIFKGDTTREVFTFGESFRYSSPKIADAFQIEVPVQIQFKHFGGQISDYLEHVTTFFNMAAGLRINISIAQNTYGTAGFEYLRFINNVIPGHPGDIISNGNADWFGFHYDYRIFSFTSSYWRGHDFYAPDGNGIYMNVFDFDSDYVIHNRKVFTNSLFITFLPGDYMELKFGIDTYYDVRYKRMDHAITLHLNFEKLFNIVSIR